MRRSHSRQVGSVADCWANACSPRCVGHERRWMTAPRMVRAARCAGPDITAGGYRPHQRVSPRLAAPDRPAEARTGRGGAVAEPKHHLGHIGPAHGCGEAAGARPTVGDAECIERSRAWTTVETGEMRALPTVTVSAGSSAPRKTAAT